MKANSPLKLFFEQDTTKKRLCLVQLTPKDMRGQESINLGFEIIKRKIEENGWIVDIAYYGDKINKNEYDIIGFSIFYVTQMLNLIPFLKDNNIEPMSEIRNKPLLIAGGQGVHNPLPISKFIDIFSIGEGEETIVKILKAYEQQNFISIKDEIGIYIPIFNKELILPIERYDFSFSHVKTIDSEPIIFKKRAMLELTRGCKFRCKFCQYGWTAGKYREKDLELVKEQIWFLRKNRIRNINFLSCNLGGYSKLKELLEFCIETKTGISNTDMRVDEYTEEIAVLLEKLKVKTLKIGVESFCEETRFAMNKKITDLQMDEFFERALRHDMRTIHFYMIYGLPGDNYDHWFDVLRKHKEIIKIIQDRSIKLDYSITNFLPSLCTPMEKLPGVDFVEKDLFLKKYLKVLEETGHIKDAEDKWYHNMHGKLGLKEETYKIVMMLLHGNESLTEMFLKFDKGVGRSIDQSLYEKLTN